MNLSRKALAGGSALLLAAVMGINAMAGGSAVKEGHPAPDVKLPATQAGLVLPGQKDAKTLHLSDLKGKKNVVLFFYPKALTGG